MRKKRRHSEHTTAQHPAAIQSLPGVTFTPATNACPDCGGKGTVKSGADSVKRCVSCRGSGKAGGGGSSGSGYQTK